jgi:hypothetical protein
MKIEFLILSDASQVVGGKLFMLGGAWNLHRSGNYPSQFQFSIALSILVPWDEAGIRHQFTLTIADDAGVPVIPQIQGHFEVGKSDQIPKEITQRALVSANITMAVPRPGRYIVSATAGASKVDTTFDAIFIGQKIALTPESSREKGNYTAPFF